MMFLYSLNDQDGILWLYHLKKVFLVDDVDEADEVDEIDEKIEVLHIETIDDSIIIILIQ